MKLIYFTKCSLAAGVRTAMFARNECGQSFPRSGIWMTCVLTLACSVMIAGGAQEFEIGITNIVTPGNTPPIPVSLSGFTGEAADVIQFDLYVQGFSFTAPDAAQYLLSGSNNGNLTGRATDRFNKASLVSKSYTGATLRRQAHAFVDDFLKALGRKGIGSTKIAFKADKGASGEIYIA